MQIEGSPAVLAPQRRRIAIGGLVAFFVIGAAGLYWAKWDPYFHKTLTVAGTHKLGTSILTGITCGA